jgi:hypothetical protein
MAAKSDLQTADNYIIHPALDEWSCFSINISEDGFLESLTNDGETLLNLRSSERAMNKMKKR